MNKYLVIHNFETNHNFNLKDSKMLAYIDNKKKTLEYSWTLYNFKLQYQKNYKIPD